MTLLRRYAGAIAWVVAMLAVSLLFYDEKQDDAKDRRDGQVALVAAEKATEAVERVEQEGLERAYELCTSSNEARAVLLTLIESSVADEAALSPEAQEFLERARAALSPQECPPDPSPGDGPP